MRQKIRKYRDCHSQKPLHIPNRTTSLRQVLDRVNAGLPVNAQMAQHQPLPPDGNDLEDFETGTEEYLDLVDVQHLNERIKAQAEKARKKQIEEAEKKKQEDFQRLVDEEIARRSAEHISPHDV